MHWYLETPKAVAYTMLDNLLTYLGAAMKY